MLPLRAFLELLRYDFAHARRGFPGVYESVRRVRPRAPDDWVILSRAKSLDMSVETAGTSACVTPGSPAIVSKICDAVASAACVYWKPVLCLQRAVVITRLLRRHGVAAELVIGYRPSPFLSHAWVEVDGKIVNDSPAYQERLLVLDRI